MTGPAMQSISPARQMIERLVADVLADPSATFGYAVARVSYGDPAEISLTKDGASFVIWVRPVSDHTRAYRTTERFNIGYRGDPPDRHGYAVLDAVCRHVEAAEHALREFDARPVAPPEPPATLEWLAVRCGLKPACSFLVDPGVAERAIGQARAQGLEVRTAVRTIESDARPATGAPPVLIYVGRTATAAEAMHAAESSVLGRPRTERRVRTIASALGYPSCCTEAFIHAGSLAKDEIRFAALARTPGQASRFLNDLDPWRTLVSHYVCRYDCEPSVRHARAVLHELGHAEPAAASDLERSLAGLVVRFRRGGALRLVLSGAPGPQSLRFDAVEVWGDHAWLEEWRAALRAADELQVVGDEARLLRGGRDAARIALPADEVQVRPFV